MKQVLLCTMLLCVVTLNTSAQNIEWAKRILAGGGQVLNAAHTDAAGNNYVTGYFGGGIQQGDILIQGNGLGDMFIIKYSAAGEALWARQSRSEGWEGGRAIDTDANGNVYCAGRIEGNSQLGSENLTAAGSNDALVVKYDSEGTVQWARAGGGAGLDWANGVAVDAQGNVFITGQYLGAASFGALALSGNGDNNDAFLVKYNAAGDVLWALSGGGSGDDWAYDVATDANGDAYVVGSFEGSANIFGRSISSNGGVDGFIAKVSGSGQIMWLKAIGSTELDVAESVDVRADGSLVLAGSFRGNTCSVGGDATLNNNGDADIFVAQYAGDGSFRSALAIGGAGVDGIAGFGQSVALEAAEGGQFWLTSSFSQQLNLGEISLNSAGESDMFTALFNADGTAEWATSAGGGAADNFIAMGAAANGDVFVAVNYFSNPIQFGEFSFGASGSLLSSFVGKLTLQDLVLPATMGLSAFNLEFGAVALGQELIQTLTIESLGDEDLIVSSLSHFDPEAADKGFTILSPDVNSLPRTLSKGETLDVQIEYAPSAIGEVLSDIVIESNDQKRSFEIVDLTGSGVESQQEVRINLDVSELDFAEVVRGEDKSLSFNIRSIGEGVLIVNALEFVNADAATLGFNILSPLPVNLPIELAQDEVMQVEIEFSPAAVGSVHSELRIITNADSDATLILPLRGTGTDPTSSVHETRVERQGSSLELLGGGNIAGQNLQVQLSFSTSRSASLELIGLDGRVVDVVNHRVYAAGSHFVQFKARKLVRGVYYLRLITDDLPLGLPILLQ